MLVGSVSRLACLCPAAADVIAQTGDPGPLSIARQGYLFAGGKYATVNGRRVLSGHLYAEFQMPARQTHVWPIIMMHGGGQSGTNFTGTPDGREGWAQFFLRQGYAVYVVDQPGRGRAAYEVDVYGPASKLNPGGTERRFAAPLAPVRRPGENRARFRSHSESQFVNTLVSALGRRLGDDQDLRHSESDPAGSARPDQSDGS